MKLKVYIDKHIDIYRQTCYLVGDLPSATLTEKGCASIKKASEEREDADAIQPFPGDCR